MIVKNGVILQLNRIQKVEFVCFDCLNEYDVLETSTTFDLIDYLSDAGIFVNLFQLIDYIKTNEITKKVYDSTFNHYK